ncbi:MAG: ABC transporter ATP-binding protein [Clostridia bacterium]|nr:ABC transporter ATP-binding protein [Clostridia bacterium]
MEKFLEVKNIGKKFQNKDGEVQAIKDVNFSVNSGEFVSIIGPSGCGKSTLLSVIAGLETKSEGEIYIENEKIDGISPKVGYMLQRDCLLEWKTIFSNAIFGLEVKGKKNEENIKYVENLLKKYNLYDFKDKYPSEISGGMRQRVALIRTLAVKPKILLLDEAFSALDYQTRIMVTNDIYQILRKENITALIVTHDISEAISMSDRVLVLTKRPGTVKNIHKIEFEIDGRTPLNCRESPKFSNYFNILWKELGVDEK